MNFFRAQETPYHAGYYVISPITENIPFSQMSGSWNVLPARILGLKYIDYLRMCRDDFEATFFPSKKKEIYLCPYFEKNDANELCEILNRLAAQAYELRNT